jgi:hypothetical protein
MASPARGLGTSTSRSSAASIWGESMPAAAVEASLPSSGRRSKRRTVAPARASARAVKHPTSPPPTTMASVAAFTGEAI